MINIYEASLKMSENWIPTWVSLLWVVFFVIIFVTISHIALKKARPDKPPGVIQNILETFIVGFDNLISSITGGRLKKVYPYFFSIFILLIFSVVITLFGFESPALSLAFTFTLGSITFIGIYVVGITSKGLWGFVKDKYKNPFELIQQFSPLLSISIRLFGATFGFTAILMILPLIFKSFDSSQMQLVGTYWPLISLPWSWVLQSADIFLSLIQAYVFTLLTATYWSLELSHEDRDIRKQIKANKQKK